MPRSVVHVPFGWSPNGYDHEDLVVGNERDFGSNTDGLRGLGWIGDVVPVAQPEPVVEVAPPAPPEPEAPASEAPIVEVEPVVEPAPQPRKRRK